MGLNYFLFFNDFKNQIKVEGMNDSEIKEEPLETLEMDEVFHLINILI